MHGYNIGTFGKSR